uniref:Uncharacterized protein n=1 Tax=Zea mays TaxID=4577 RepID=C0HGR9_MAIZE|nr:unknown [Zea mays]
MSSLIGVFSFLEMTHGFLTIPSTWGFQSNGEMELPINHWLNQLPACPGLSPPVQASDHRRWEHIARNVRTSLQCIVQPAMNFLVSLAG